jgi:UPF0755 protein
VSTPDRLRADPLGPPAVPASRSDRDRESARRERAARRAGRGATAAPPSQAPNRPGADHSTNGGSAPGRGGRHGDRPPRPSAGPPRPPSDAAARRRVAVLALFGVGGLLALWILFGFLAPFAGEGGDPVRVRIPQGAGVSQIAELLDERGVVASRAVFSLRVRLSGRGEELKPGSYRLRRGMSYGTAIDDLAAGPARNTVNVTVPEGRARGEVTPLVRAAGVDGNYERASRRSDRLDPADYGAQGAGSLEGFLFPSTYELPRGASAEDLVNRQLDAFKREFRKVDLSEARRRNLTPYEVLVIASMVEREAQIDRERPLVASVIYNRIQKGEPLGIDATTRYATENWTRPLTQSQLAADSPYNTRTTAGLPPGPIGNPGVASMQAAAKPAKTDYMFYVVKPNTCGEHAFSRTMADFTRDSQTYNSERAARGGQSPTDCPE